VWRQDVLARCHDSRRRAQGLFSEIFPKMGALVKFFRKRSKSKKKSRVEVRPLQTAAVYTHAQHEYIVVCGAGAP
jgi:hypothetical protein